MYSKYQLTAKYLRYFLNAHNGKGHGMHSPFVFDFILHVLNNKSGYQPPASIGELRQNMLHDPRVLQVQDLGAGSRGGSDKHRKVSSIAAHAVKPEKYGELLFRLVKHYQPKTIIELGTSLGITTSYLASANTNAEVHTVEGSAAIAEVAAENFRSLGLQDIKAHTGNFDTVLPQLLKVMPVVDFAYVDGNHLYSPTINYFHVLLEKVHPGSILVFDDIHWSAEMEAAWREIQQHPDVQCTVDIFFLGFVFFKKEFRVKQDFLIRF